MKRDHGKARKYRKLMDAKAIPDWKNWPQRSKCVLLNAPSTGLTACSVAYDCMHSKFLGVDQVAFGSILWLLCFEILEDTPLKNLQSCWQFILQSYKAHGITERYRGMRKLTMFCKKKGGPKLKGRAAQVQNLTKPLLELWQHHMNSGSEINRKILTMLRLDVAMEKIMKDNSENLAFAPPDSINFKKFGFAAAQIHRDLALHFATHKPPLFADIPKLHAVLHSVLACDYLNPKLTWCFRQESNMNVRKTLAMSCARGIQGPQVTAKMVAKMRVALDIQWGNDE